MKLLSHSHTAAIALAALAFAPFAFAQEAPKADAKMPPVKIDPTPVPPVTGTITTFAPIVDKVAASVVTVSTSKMVRRGQQQQNPLFNDPMFRRFFGIPDQGDDDT